MPRSVAFYTRVFEFEVIDVSERLTALAVGPKQLILLCAKLASAKLPRTAHDGEGRLHVAFAVPTAALASWKARLVDLGISVVERRQWPRGGESIYFRDPDDHLLELATPGVWSNY